MRFAWEAMGWERLGPGVGRRRLPGLDCTAGLVAGDGAALVVDAGGTLAEGARVRADAERLLGPGGRVTHLALTHPHFDHVLGTAAFTGTSRSPAGAVPGGAVPRGAVPADAVPADAARAVPGGAPAAPVRDAEVFGAVGIAAALADGAVLCADAVAHGIDARDAADAVAALRPPRHSVSGERTLDLGGGVQVLLANVGPGHTAHDLAVLVSAAPTGPEIVFCGDLVEESGEPQAGPDAVPERWPAALDRLLSLGGDDALYVPGHGAVVDAAFVRRQRDDLAARFGVA